ncbi:MAG: diglucosylglycerate octanoyltransferase [Candidatus Nanopelagicales bacterium]
MPHLLVIADSLAFHGPERSERPSDPRLYPQVAGRLLGFEVDLVARQGWTARDGWWALTKDPVVWGEYLQRADGLLIGVGGMDQLPTPVPTWLRESIPYIRQGRVRRAARDAVRSSTPPLVRAVGGPFRTLPQAATDRYLTRIVQGVRTMRPGLPIALLGPPPWTGQYYPSTRNHASALAAARAWAAREGVAYVDIEPIVSPRLAACNPDGMHWSWEVHSLVGEAVARTLSR